MRPRREFPALPGRPCARCNSLRGLIERGAGCLQEESIAVAIANAWPTGEAPAFMITGRVPP